MSSIMIIQFLVLTAVVSGVLIFILHKVLIASTDGAVSRLSRETDEVRVKQTELNKKIKEAKEELDKKRREAEALAAKMVVEAEEAAKTEREKILQKARQDSDEIIKKAHGTKDEIRQAVMKEMEVKAVDYTVDLLKAVLSEQARGALAQKLTSEFMEGLRKVDMTLVVPEVKNAQLVVAQEADEGLRQELKQILKEKLNREITVEVLVDPKIISGAILRFGSLNLDGSLQSSIIESGASLKEKIEKEDI